MSVTLPLVVNQIEISLASPGAISDGLTVAVETITGQPRKEPVSGFENSGTLDYCRLHDMQVQAWSPLNRILNPPADASPKLKATIRLLTEIAKTRNTSPAVIGLAWLLRHPAGIVPIVGTSHPEYLIEDCKADHIQLTREEWYSLFAAAA